MTSKARINANRRNAQKSTGPRTPDGKNRVRFNALKHGLLAKNLILDTAKHNESREEFDFLLCELLHHYLPYGPIEHMLVEKIAVAYWRLQRALRTEADLMHQAIVDRQHCVDTGNPPNRVYHGNQWDQKWEQYPATPDKDYPNRVGIPSPEQVFRLTRYERAIELQLHRALTHLERIQARRNKQLTQGAPPPAAGSGVGQNPCGFDTALHEPDHSSILPDEHPDVLAQRARQAVADGHDLHDFNDDLTTPLNNNPNFGSDTECTKQTQPDHLDDPTPKNTKQTQPCNPLHPNTPNSP